MEENFEYFSQLFCDELSIDKQLISASTNFRDIPTWGSLNALLLISRINEEYDVFLTSSDLALCTTILDIYSVIIRQK